MRKIFAFGDSFIVGDQDDFLHELEKNEKPTHSMEYAERVEYLKYNVSFVSQLSKYYKLDLENYAVRGSGNFPQLDKVLQLVQTGRIKENDIILFGMTTLLRDRFSIIEFKRVNSNNYGPCMIDRDLLNDEMILILRNDLFYILSTLEIIRLKFNVNVYAYHIFDNLRSKDPNINFDVFQFENIMDPEFYNNSLIDIVNDSWNKKITHPYHTQLIVPHGYESFYTKNKHFSIQGQAKVFDWFLNNKILDRFIDG